jgi:hypothetical protein
MEATRRPGREGGSEQTRERIVTRAAAPHCGIAQGQQVAQLSGTTSRVGVSPYYSWGEEAGHSERV